MSTSRIANSLKSFFTDGYLVSYPKCGRTWLTLMLGNLMANESSKTPDNPLRLKEYSDPLHQVPKIRVSHDDNPHEKPLSRMSTDVSLYRYSRVIFLYRDPRDVVVSLWFHNSKRLERDVGTLDNFVWNGIGGLATIVQFYNRWFENSRRLRNVHMLAYEDLRSDTHYHLEEVARFLRIPGIDAACIDAAVSENQFGRMQQRERSGYYTTDRMQAANVQDPDSYKTRRAKVGGYRDYLETDQVTAINAYLRENLHSFYCDRYVNT